jgi:hypothetical protein
MAAKAIVIEGAEKTTVAALADELRSREAANGGSSKFIELQGNVICDQPIEAELSGTKCVHYEIKVVREYEESYTTTNNDGSSQVQTRRGSENVSINSRGCVFSLDDGTGRMEVDPSGAEFHPVTTVDRFEPGETLGSIGSFVLSEIISGTGRRTIGYRLEEKCLPVDRPVYAFGEASFVGGKLRLTKNQERGHRFIISAFSGDQLARSAKTASLWLTIASLVALVGSLVLFYLSFMRR